MPHPCLMRKSAVTSTVSQPRRFFLLAASTKSVLPPPVYRIWNAGLPRSKSEQSRHAFC